MADQPFNQQEAENGGAQSKWWSRPHIVAAAILIIIVGVSFALGVCAVAAGVTTNQDVFIVGGIPAKLPSAVSVQRVRGGSRNHICSGNVVDSQHIYLPAQCLKELNPTTDLIVQFGRTNLDDEGGETRRVNDFRIHPKWDENGRWRNDQALLKMASPVVFTEDIQPVCLADDGSLFPTGTKGIVYGWGDIESGELPPPRALQGVNVTVTDHRDCKRIYGGRVDRNMICAGNLKGGQDTCKGDAGGALIVKQGDDSVMAGFVIRGPRTCGVPGVPTVYWTLSKEFITSAIEEMRDPLPECGTRPPAVGQDKDEDEARDEAADVRIENGQVAAPHSWPWMVALQRSDGRFRGGGSLINQYFVATFSASPGEFVVLGAHDLSSTTEDTQRIKVEQVFYHPNYTDSNWPQYGMWLAKLSSPVKFNKNVKPVCVPEAGDFPPAGKTCMFTGWGRDRYPEPSYHTDLLHETSATIITNDQCRRDWTKPDKWITNTTFCTAASKSYPSVHDGGGPLMCENDDASWTLNGIIYSGLNRHPSLYGNVTSMAGWMNQIITADDASRQVCFKRVDG